MAAVLRITGSVLFYEKDPVSAPMSFLFGDWPKETPSSRGRLLARGDAFVGMLVLAEAQVLSENG